MIKDNQLTCDKCGFLFANVTSNGHRALHVFPSGLNIKVYPAPSKEIAAICPKCKALTPFPRAFIGVK